MKNVRFDNKAKLQLFITAVQDHAKVTVKTSISNFRQEKILRLGETFTTSIPSICELDTLNKIQCSVIVQSSADVVVTALNYKDIGADTSVVYPTSEWGTEYYIFTPNVRNNKEFSITNGKHSNTVKVFARGTFKYKNVFYKKGSSLLLILRPYESVLFESPLDFTGIRVSSERPVAVFTGHTCYLFWYIFCNHIYEQLLPVSKWGSTFVVPGLTVQEKFNIVYVMASQPTRVNLKFSKQRYVIAAGDLLQIQISQKKPLYIQADHGIQVLMMFKGAQNPFRISGSFLTSVLSTDRYCSQYSLTSIEKFDNVALIVAPSNAVAKLRLDGKPLSTKWTSFQSKEYFWTQINSNGRNTLSSSGIPFGLYSIGFKSKSGYGSVGQCVQTGKVHALYKVVVWDLKCIFKKNILLKNINKGLHFVLQESQ